MKLAFHSLGHLNEKGPDQERIHLIFLFFCSLTYSDFNSSGYLTQKEGQLCYLGVKLCYSYIFSVLIWLHGPGAAIIHSWDSSQHSTLNMSLLNEYSINKKWTNPGVCAKNMLELQPAARLGRQPPASGLRVAFTAVACQKVHLLGRIFLCGFREGRGPPATGLGQVTDTGLASWAATA